MNIAVVNTKGGVGKTTVCKNFITRTRRTK